MDPAMRVRGHRHLLKAVTATTLALTLTACDFFSLNPEGTENGSDGATGGQQAPMLAERVDSGDLPPLEERLPEEPVVVEPHDRLGTYGGEWTSAILGVGDWPWLGRTVGYENLTRWDPEWEETIPNLAKDWEYNEDATEVTFHLREGLKWSDGEPFTAEDIVFAMNDIISNPEVSPDAANDPGQAEKIDELTVKLIFPEPSALWTQWDLLNFQVVNKPAHYLKEFHADYNPDAPALAEEEGFDSWIDMLNHKVGVTVGDTSLYWQNPDIPTMYPWVVEEPLADSGQMILERNPYYWKVDPEGRQLPYIDRVVFDVVQDEEVMLTQALNGDINMHSRHFNTLANRSVLADNRERGNYDFFELQPGEMNTNIISLNLTHQDETMREIFRDKDFRIALSHAINRQEIIDVVYKEQGEPWQAAPRRDAPFYNEELAKQYTEYDVERANELLDEAGYDERNSDGVRLGPDGEPISFSLAVPGGFRPDIVDSMEMVIGYWSEVGIEARLETEERSLFYERKQNNAHDANVWSGDNGLKGALFDPRWYVPLHNGESNFAIPWAEWYVSDGESELSQRPPEAPRRQMELYDELLASPDPQRQNELMSQILDIAQEQFYVMGISLSPPSYGIVANNFHNVPESMYAAAVYNNPGPTNPEQYFIE
ncbi:ABC transporter substrate-binding protein [Salinactinospora qingdaonensis]|uniref:ABC transporter substrate-binding protein n=1 Tax=Salinactinospora qingdaonensis TaxID=702744 RepID=A0ABP7FTF7_9ACTN